MVFSFGRFRRQGTQRRQRAPRRDFLGLLCFLNFLYFLYFPSSGSGDFCRYAATPVTALMAAAATAILNVAPMPAFRLKCCGSIPTAAKPVSTPPAAPEMAAARIPLSQMCKVGMGL